MFVKIIKSIDPALDSKKSITSKGFHHLSSGAFASVYAKKQVPYVLKRAEASLDAAQLAYLLMANRYQKRNPFLPRVHWIKLYIDSRYPIHGTKKQQAKWVRDHDYSAYYVACVEKLKADREAVSQTAWSVEDFLFHHSPLANRELKRAAVVIQDANAWADRHNLLPFYDIHKLNVLLRGEQPVITDPLAHNGWCPVKILLGLFKTYRV